MILCSHYYLQVKDNPAENNSNNFDKSEWCYHFNIRHMRYFIAFIFPMKYMILIWALDSKILYD